MKGAMKNKPGEFFKRKSYFRRAIKSLLLYSLLPIIRNTYTGIREVDPDLVAGALHTALEHMRDVEFRTDFLQLLDKLGGERIYASDEVVRMMAGEMFRELEPIE